MHVFFLKQCCYSIGQRRKKEKEEVAVSKEVATELPQTTMTIKINMNNVI